MWKMFFCCRLNHSSMIYVKKWFEFTWEYLITPWKMNGWNVPITHLERNMIFQTSMIMFHVNLQGCKPAGRFQKSFLFGIFISKKSWRVGIVDLQRYLRWKSQPGKLHQKIDGLPLKGGHHGGGWFLKENKHKTQVIYSVLCSWRVWHAGERHFCSSWQQTPTKIKKTKHDLHKPCTSIKAAQNKNMQSIHPQPWVDAQSFTFFCFLMPVQVLSA